MSDYTYTPRVFSRGCVHEVVLVACMALTMTLWTLALDGWAAIACALTFGLVIAFGMWR